MTIPMTCRNCFFLFVFEIRLTGDEPSPYACRQPNWAGYVLEPDLDQAACGGVAFVPAWTSTAKPPGTT